MKETFYQGPPIDTGTDFSGVGAFDQALARLGIKQNKKFACDMDKHARKTYLENYGTPKDLEILETEDCKFIDDIYYRGMVDTKLRPPTPQEWERVHYIEERVARSFSFYYPWNVYSRQIPKKPLKIYFPTPPCQAFSMAGKRKGEDDKRGILFYNSHEFITINKPEIFVFENVKGLVSHDKGRTFQRWIDLLAGKSVNGTDKAFPHEEAVPYHVYYRVLNAKQYTVPQNRERIFIIGIRDDIHQGFTFPRSMQLLRSLRDCLEEKVDDKYFLSDKILAGFMKHAERHNEKGNGFNFETRDPDGVASSLLTNTSKMGPTHNYIETPGLEHVGDLYENSGDAGRVYDPNGIGRTLKAEGGGGGAKTGLYLMREEEVMAGAIRGRNPANPNDRKAGNKTEQMLEISDNPNISNCLTTVEKDNVLIVKFERTEEAKANRRASMANTGKDTGSFSQRQVKTEPQDFSDTILANPNPQKDGLIAVASGTKKGFEIAGEGDSINISQIGSKTRRGRVGDQIANTLETACNQAVVVKDETVDNGLYKISCGCGYEYVGTLRDLCPGCNEIRDGYTNEITDEVVQLNSSKESNGKQPFQHNRIYADYGVSCAIDTESGRRSIYTKYRVRRLTPRECFRLMDFPDTFTWSCADTQAYKQAGNSVVVAVIVELIKKLKIYV